MSWSKKYPDDVVGDDNLGSESTDCHRMVLHFVVVGGVSKMLGYSIDRVWRAQMKTQRFAQRDPVASP